ncbi:MAG: 3-phosphoserine/phosphohydroxythreonine transaminase [Phycisphaerae bacterium]|nr:3-phosphoserine/phosphohydroxythreonine transaminase [Phycisphaerae bacterium]
MTTVAAPTIHSAGKAASDRVYNFSAGPGVLPEPVLRQAQQDIWNIQNSGVGILEHSHRGPVFDKVLAECIDDLREVGNIPADYDIFFVQGGASSQCFMVPMNFIRDKAQTADYFNTGKWASDSIKEAKLFCNVNVVASSEATNHDRIPARDSWKFSNNPAYLHFTSNNTIFGTQWKAIPTHPSNCPIVCDMSSDFFSKPTDFSRYDLVYAGAQKNLGPSGVVLVVAKKSLIDSGRDDLPTMLKYKTHARNESRYNTPPTFAIYLVGQTAKWLKSFGGLKAMQAYNEEKAAILYDYLDRSSFYRGHVQKDSRSLMNVTFKCPTEELDKKFCKEAEKAGLDALKGHRSTGGMRASLYNAFPIEGVRALVDFMKRFESQKH